MNRPQDGATRDGRSAGTRRPLSRLALGLVVLVAVAGIAAPAVAQPPAPVVQTRTLSNGLTLIVEERPDWPAVGMALTVRVGTRDDAAERLGEVALLARAMLGGTTSRPSFADLVTPVFETGGSIDLQIGPDLTTWATLVPAGEEAVALDTLADMLLNPRFGLVETGEALRETYTEEYTVLGEALVGALWPGHPAARPPGGTRETLEAISYPDLLALRERYYGARNITLAVVGNVSAERFAARAEAALAGVPAGEPRPLRPAAAGPPKAGRETQPGFGELARVLVAYPTVGRDSPDYPAVLLLGLLLNGPDGLIFQEVRSRHGLARDVDAQTLTFADIGLLAAVARVQPANIEATLFRFESVFARLRDEPLPAATLARLRSRYAGEAVLVREFAAFRADELAGRAALGLAGDDELRAAIDRLTPADLQAAARRYLTPDRAVIDVLDPDAPDTPDD